MVPATGDSWTARRHTARPSPPLHLSVCLQPPGPWAGLPGSIRIHSWSIADCSAFPIENTEIGHGGSTEGVGNSVAENKRGLYGTATMHYILVIMWLLLLTLCNVIHMLCIPFQLSNYQVSTPTFHYWLITNVKELQTVTTPSILWRKKALCRVKLKYPSSHLQERSWRVVSLLGLIASLTVLCYFQSSLSSIVSIF